MGIYVVPKGILVVWVWDFSRSIGDISRSVGILVVCIGDIGRFYKGISVVSGDA